MKREFLQLAHTYDQKKHSVGGWFLSEKLDGQRCFWDGGVSLGIPAVKIPWANVEKDLRHIKERISTGLWSRYGKVIHAPDWFIDQLPKFPLDGELYLGRGDFQELSSIIKRLEPDSRWKNVKFVIFDAPSYSAVFADGKINNTNFKKTFEGCLKWLAPFKGSIIGLNAPSFEGVYRALIRIIKESDNVVLHEQHQLPFHTKRAEDEIESVLSDVEKRGGEGLILRHPVHLWKPERVHTMLKVKSKQDDEATVVGYTWGRKTELGSKLLGLMGALIVDYKGKRFELSGFTDQERQMMHVDLHKSAREIGCNHPGEIVAPEMYNPTFRIGTKVTFTFRELTVDGIPKEARFKRIAH